MTITPPSLPPPQDAMIRYFCQVHPGAAGETPAGYLEALAATGRAVRAQPIGVANFDIDGRWRLLRHLFITPMTTPFVNVVCAPAGLSLGQRFTLKIDRRLGHVQTRPDVVYEPETALVGYYTLGCFNVAITSPFPAPSPHELQALAKYDLVICPRPADALELANLMLVQIPVGVPRHARVLHVDPRPDLLGAQLDLLCESATSATTRPSRASVAPPATTPPPLPPQAMRSRSSTGDRSPATPTPAGTPTAQSSATNTSMRASVDGPSPKTGTIRRMWSWLTGNRNS